jgi:hypothetical protein
VRNIWRLILKNIIKANIYKVLLAILILTIPILSIGCLTSQPAATPPVKYLTEAEVNALITQALTTKNYDNLIAGKANSADITATVNTAVNNAIASQLNDSNSTLSKKFADLQTQINNKQDKSGSSSNPDSNASKEELVDTNKDLELYLTEITPASDPFYLGTSSTLRFEFEVKNTHTTNSRNFDITVTMYPDEDVTINASSDYDIFTDVTDMEIEIDPNEGIVLDASDGDSFEIKCLNGWVGKNDTQDITLIISLDTNEATEWDYNIDIRQTN